MKPTEDAPPSLRDSDTHAAETMESDSSKEVELVSPPPKENGSDVLPTSPAPASPSPSPESPSSPARESKVGEGSSEDMMTKVFQFLSTATPETLGGIGVGLAGVTYFILGQLGLLLIGAFAGVTLFISWEGRQPDVARAVKGEKGVDAIARISKEREALREHSKPKDMSADEDEDESRGFEDFQPETRDALNSLVDAVIKDYVKWWYGPILPADRSFPMSCRKVFASYLLAVANHLSKKRPADTFLDFLTNSSSIVIVFFSELSAAFAELPPDSTKSGPDAISHYLSSNPHSNLANLLNKKQQAAKFKMVAEDLLGFLDRPTYDCDPARVFLREILAGVILEMTLQSCSKPEWINGWIVHLLEAGEPDFNQAIDSGMQRSPDLPNAFADLDGNVGNIGLTKGNRNSLDMARRRESVAAGHKKKLSRADEEMEAMEEMKRLNEMIAEEDARRAREEAKQTSTGPIPAPATEEASDRLTNALERNANELDIHPGGQGWKLPGAVEPLSPGSLPQKSPKDASGDETSSSGDPLKTPLTPGSSQLDAPSQDSSPQRTADNTASSTSARRSSQFTSFDQIVPPAQDESDSDAEQGGTTTQQTQPPAAAPAPPLTLHNATVTIHDDGVPDKSRIKNKPSWDYLIQVEPSSSHHRGWMIVRKYSDFEQLHEVLGRIARISGAAAFTEQHSALPSWKVHTKASLRGELERYCRDACWYQPLAESEGMKRFLDKDNIAAAAQKNTHHSRGAASRSGFEAFENMGKNVLGVLQSAPKGVAEGGKVVVGGVTGVLGNIGLGSRKNTITAPAAPPPLSSTSSLTSSLAVREDSAAAAGTTTTTTSTGSKSGGGGSVSVGGGNPTAGPTASTKAANRLSISTPPRMDSTLSLASSRKSRDSMDSQRSSVISTQPGKVAPMESPAEADGLQPRGDRWDRSSTGGPASARSSREHSRAHSRASSMAPPLRSPSSTSLSGIKLPPPPNEMPEDFGEQQQPLGRAATAPTQSFHSHSHSQNQSSPAPSRPLSMVNGLTAASSSSSPNKPRTPRHSPSTAPAPLTEQETGVAVELLFAVISELYTLSSAWNIRRTLLAAAKSFLLRPGNPSLLSVRSLIQTGVLDANSSDAGVAAHLRKLRENSLPTEEELAAWPAEMSAEEKETLRKKARALLIRSGVPAALSGVMGQAATGEALGRVFDCLQVQDVGRGLLFGVMLQAVRAVTH